MTAPRYWNGLVLAGGRSSRMGQDKALLPWHGQPMLLHMKQLLREAGALSVVLSGHHHAHGALPDQQPGQGPVAALAQLVPTLDDGIWIIVPVDMPYLRPTLINALLDDSAACISLRDHPLPMCLRLDARTREVIARIGAAEGRGRSFRALHEALSGRILDEAPWSDQLVNCNTPEQWQALVSQATSAGRRTHSQDDDYVPK